MPESPLAPLDRLRADVIRVRGRFSAADLLSGLARERTLRPLVTMRLCQAASALPRPARIVLSPLLRMLHFRATGRAGMTLSWKTSIGGGLRIAHGWGLVVSPHARIGRNVTVFHAVTIGQRTAIADAGARTTSYPTIEDDVWIGPHALVIGGVTIGRGARIAPHTVVTQDVAAHAIVGGNPMRVLRENAPADVRNPVATAMSAS